MKQSTKTRASSSLSPNKRCKSLADEVRPVSEERYAIMAESYVDLIRQLRQEIDSYLGVIAAPVEPYLPATENVRETGA